MRTIIFFLVLLSIDGLSQKQPKDHLNPIDYIPTENLDTKKNDKRAFNKANNLRNYQLIYTTNDYKVLYGNQCALEETRKMGFEYIIELPRSYGNTKTVLGRYLSNMAVKFRLVATRSPFWKMILKKRIKRCREKSGDFVG